MKRSNIWMIVAAVILLIVIAAAIYWLAVRNKQTTAGQPGATTTGAITQDIGKPKPIDITFQGCPASGDGGDPELNTLKNRVDQGNWQPAPVASILALTWPQAIERHDRSNWSASDAAQIARYEGSPVEVEGYLYAAKKMGPESCNCHSVQNVDNHIWLVGSPGDDRTKSIVVETTPPVRSYHPAWTTSALNKIASAKQKVRISGWLLMDQEHPDQVGKTRGTIWEIHPIMQIETQVGGTWKPLDNGTTGVTSQQAASATAPEITPANTATAAPAGSANVQYNKSVQITSVFADGTKKNEPDEYVELTNGGKQPVDITDWTVEDQAARDVFKWDSYVLQPGQKVRVYTNEVHPESGGFSFGSARPIWNNSGDVAFLYDADKVLVSRFAYGNKK